MDHGVYRAVHGPWVFVGTARAGMSVGPVESFDDNLRSQSFAHVTRGSVVSVNLFMACFYRTVFVSRYGFFAV